MVLVKDCVVVVCIWFDSIVFSVVKLSRMFENCVVVLILEVMFVCLGGIMFMIVFCVLLLSSLFLLFSIVIDSSRFRLLCCYSVSVMLRLLSIVILRLSVSSLLVG